MSEPVLELAFSLVEGKAVHVVSIAVGEKQEYNVNAVAADAVHSNTSFGYSGRHDHGQLPALLASGHNARLLSAIAEAKKVSDEYITGLMACTSRGGSNVAEGKGEEGAGDLALEEGTDPSVAKKARVGEL